MLNRCASAPARILRVVSRSHPFNLLRRLRLGALLRMLNHDATVLQAQMITAPLQLAELRAAITDTERALEALQ